MQILAGERQRTMNCVTMEINNTPWVVSGCAFINSDMC